MNKEADMQTITLAAPANPLRLSAWSDQVSMYDSRTAEEHASAFRCFKDLAPYWHCSRRLTDEEGRFWQTTYYGIPDNFGNLVEVPLSITPAAHE